MKQVIDCEEKVALLKDVTYVPKCRKNWVSLSKSQRTCTDIIFKGGRTKLVAKYKNEVVIVSDRKATNSADLTVMVPAESGRPGVAFFNPG